MFNIYNSSSTGDTTEKLESYFHFLIKEYNINNTFNSFQSFLWLFSISRESFFWIILLVQQQKLEDKQLLRKLIYILFGILIVSVIFENLYLKYKTRLLVALNEAHLRYCFNLINNCDKSELLSLNLVEQFMYIESVKAGLDSIVQRYKVNSSILVSSVTVLISARRISVCLVAGMLIVFNGIVLQIEKSSVEREQKLSEENTELNNSIRNYFVESKQKIVNNLYNNEYCSSQFKSYFNNNLELAKIENNINSYNSIVVLAITLFVVLYKYKEATLFDILVYLLIVYDLDFLIDAIFESYKINKSLTKYSQHLEMLLQNKNISEEINVDKIVVNTLSINSLYNSRPNLTLTKPITFNKGDIILCEGRTGQGKTTFFKFLKSIQLPSEIEVDINGSSDTTEKSLVSLRNSTFFTIQNNKILYDDLLYDYISNHRNKPDIDRIKRLLALVEMTHIFDGNTNMMIETSVLSGGELMRISMCQTLYEIIEGDYSIILFDELDVNLDNRTAFKIFNEIIGMFNDKILFFIVHNEDLKSRFIKRLTFANNMVEPNF
jgi:ABC-type transport system involved in cytochrome bd biosynthesis fused ATPase/permease subunit